MNWPTFRKPDEALPQPREQGLTRQRSRGILDMSIPDTATQGELSMTEQDKKAAEAQAKIAAKEAKLKAAAEKKAQADAAKAEKIAAAAAKKAEAEAAKAEKEAAKAAAKAERDAARAESATGTKLGDLSARAKVSYIKGANGQLHSGDELAAALSVVPAKELVGFMVGLFNEPNKYAHLNYGQQSMNYRNRLRGAINKGLEVNGAPMTLSRVVEERDAHCTIVAVAA